MKKAGLIIFCICFSCISLFAQYEEEKGFKKENFFTGGGVTLGLGFGSYGNTFSIGCSPVFGYSIAKWLDAGILINYIYTSYSDYPLPDYKVKSSNYGGGAFTRLYPIRFLYVQAQFEHNFNRQKVIDEFGTSSTYKFDGNSFLVGGGFASGRDPLNKRPFFYIGLMADVSGVENSPYTDAYGNSVLMIWTGVQIPLFQGRRE